MERFGLGPTTPVLDLGCGTGQIAIPLVQRGVPVHAVDPDVEMLAEGLRVEASVGAVGVAWRRGDDRALTQLGLPKLQLCTMGDSFHWTDREALMTDLDGLVGPNGGVVVLSTGPGGWFDGGRYPWSDVTKEVIQEFLGPKRRAGSGFYHHSDVRHEVVLAHSPFRKVSKESFTCSRTLSIDDARTSISANQETTVCEIRVPISHPPSPIPHHVRCDEVGGVSSPAEEDFGERRRPLETTAVVGPQRGA
ncbi:MAG: class I SAM-dependent methyltransferase [Deltaproteobacteria bacterium]|nr:class I SAM-dependent methyltransferase [Deltaproteobacteria bacterium]